MNWLVGGGFGGGDCAARDVGGGNVVNGCVGDAGDRESVWVVGDRLRAGQMGKGPFELGGGPDGGGDNQDIEGVWVVGDCVSADTAVEVLFELDDGSGGGLGGGIDVV